MQLGTSVHLYAFNDKTIVGLLLLFRLLLLLSRNENRCRKCKKSDYGKMCFHGNQKINCYTIKNILEPACCLLVEIGSSHALTRSFLVADISGIISTTDELIVKP